MRILRSTDGAALVTALMLTMLSLVIAMMLLYSVTAGTRISASQKRYRSALAAAHGGVELLSREIVPRLFQSETQTSLQDDFSSINLQLSGYGCLQQKLKSSTTNWSSCSAAQSSSDPAQSPDMTFTLSGLPSEPSFRVTAKIVDTVPGNSDTTGVDYLDQGSSVSGREEGTRPRHVPGMFNISVQGVGGGADHEKGRLSLLYAY